MSENGLSQQNSTCSGTMDGLLAEVASKRKALESDAQRPAKYMRRGELERLREEEEQKRKLEKDAQEAAAKQEKETAAAVAAAKRAKVCISLFILKQVLILKWRAGFGEVNHVSFTRC